MYTHYTIVLLMANDMDIGNSVTDKIYSSIYNINDLLYYQINVDNKLIPTLWDNMLCNDIQRNVVMILRNI